MAEERRDWLEEELHSLGRELDYPPAPDIASQIRASLTRQQPQDQRRLWIAMPIPRIAVIIATVLVVCLAIAMAIVPSTRQALAEFFGLERIRVIRVSQLPTATPYITPDAHTPVPSIGGAGAITPTEEARTEDTPTPAPTSTPEGHAPVSEPGLTGAATLDEARKMLDFPVLLPSYPEGIGSPDEVYVQELSSPSDMQLVLVYRPRPGLALQASEDSNGPLFTLYQFSSSRAFLGVFTKSVDPNTKLEELSVNGSGAFWLEGAYHVLGYRDADGEERLELVEANTLAWEGGDTTYRLETRLPLEEALKIAESLLQAAP